MRNLLLAALLCGVACTASANKYYVSSTGDDANTGLSAGNAWKTITRVNDFTFQPGDTLAFEGGSTFSGSITNASLSHGEPGNRMVVTSYGTGKAIISSGLVEGMTVVNGGNITIFNLKFQGSGYKLTSVYINGISVYIDSTATAAADNIVIDSVESLGYGGWGIWMGSDAKDFGFNHLRVTNSLFHDNGIGGFQITGFLDKVTSSYGFNHSDVYIGYCKCYNNLGRIDYLDNWSGSGILLGSVVNGLVEYCESYNNGKENGSTSAGPVGIFLGDSKYVTIQHCSSHHNLGGLSRRDGGGFDLDQGSYGCVIQYCESYENDGAGYGLYQAPTVNEWNYDTVRYNTSLNDARNNGIYGSFTFWGSAVNYRLVNGQVYGNTITLKKAGNALVFINNNMNDVMIHDNDFCLDPPASYLNYFSEAPIPSNAYVYNSTFSCAGKPQQSFILPVNFRGAFAAAPTAMWTNSWANFDPQTTAYGAPDSVINTAISSSITLRSTKKYLLQGPVYVTGGAVLTIEAGTLVRADKNTPNSSLVITKGSKIIARANQYAPIIFTSSQPVNQRAKGDWGGIYLLGKAQYNGAGGKSYLSGFDATADNEYGGSDDNDTSGVLQYVRIEYAGSAPAPALVNSGLTMAAVGRGTVIDHVQVSYSKNDAFKWIGGAANARYLLAYKNDDDNWDVSKGYHGAVQYGLGLRDSLTATGTANEIAEGTQSSNDETASDATSFTSGVFCNFTEIGPLRGNKNAVINPAYKHAARYNNNSRLRMINSILMDYPAGIGIEGEACISAAYGSFISPVANKSPGNLVFKNNLVAGAIKAIDTDGSWDMAAWFGTNKNDSLASTDNILAAPYTAAAANVFTGDYRPAANSAALKNTNWNDSTFYYVDSAGRLSNLIPCPIFVSTPAVIAGATNAYPYIQSGDTAKYYITARSISGVLRYNWSVPAGVTIIAGQGTDTLVVKYAATFTSGAIGVLNFSYCGASSGKRQLTVTVTAPAIYTFTGDGNWNVAANWSNGIIPPASLPAGAEIIIAHIDGGSCILNVPQNIAPGGKLTVQPNKNLIVMGNLTQK